MNYTNTNNLVDSSNVNVLINICESRIDNCLNKNYIIYQNDTSYNMLVFDEHITSDNIISNINGKLISYYRSSESGYNYTYNYSINDVNDVSFTGSYIYLSNVNAVNSIISSEFEQRLNDNNIIYLLMFILSLLFAYFLLKERSSL